MSCAELEEEDYLFLSRREKAGFRWYCTDCVVDADDAISKKKADSETEKRLQNIESLVSNSMQKLGERLDILEKKCVTTSLPSQKPDIEPVTFAEIVRKTLQEEKESGVVVNDHGRTKTIEHQNVLVIKPKSGNKMTDIEIKDSVSGIEKALEEVQVSDCKKIKSGGLVMKFPNKEAMSEASHEISTRLGPGHAMQVTEPKKMLPKMTVPDVSLSLADDEVVASILKNPNIQQLVEGGCVLSLVFTRTKEHSKTAVFKMAPEIRSEIVNSGNYVYVGLKRCKAYDRFWVVQCYHCQGFGHISSSCPKKDASPVCACCACKHETKACTNKDSPRCANCLLLENPPSTVSHFASSSACPVMMSQRKKIIENTNFSSSKNLLDL